MIQDILANNENIHINDKQIAILKEHFPSCFSADGSFDIVKFQEEIKDKTEVTTEGYELRFLGKSYAKLLASTDTTTVIVPDDEHNQLPENKNSENLYISGDNLDGLKHLLNSYQNQVRCIYIDPPYNTGTDGFVYNDNFNYTVEELQDKLSIDETQAKRILDLSRRGSASHSAWLMFMYPRLLLARDLLTDDGVIFISIDDNEQANLKLLCDDIFGEENFVSKFDWRKKTGANDAKDIAVVTESILLYTKRHSVTIEKGIWASDQDSINKSRYKLDDEFLEIRGKYYLDTLDRGGLQYSDSLNFGIEAPDGGIIFPNGRSKFINDGWIWKWSKQKIEWGLNNKFLEFVKSNKSTGSKYTIKYKVYQNVDNEANVREKLGRAYSNLITTPINQQGKSDFSNLFDGRMLFSNPKPIGLIHYLLKILCDKSVIVLDFFSGSGSTAHAVMQLNAEDEGTRKFITVQLPEVLNENIDSQNAAYKFLQENNLPITLDYVGIERIKRAALKIKEENPDKILDLGFKHFILKEPNQNTLDKCETFDKAALISDATILDDFGAATVLSTWLNNDGYGLSTEAQAIELAGYTAYYKDKHLYLIYPDFTQEALEALLTKYDTDASFNPENIILFGYSFSEWSVTEMLEKNLKILNDSEKNLKINYAVRY